ncbi:MAG TPA: twin-arginine translocase TatA/TatE family subunit [Actinomycetota bacterium]|nr:twin-arginine translocase TatA/TatE family subunit [Actinomycetota bacterium]
MFNISSTELLIVLLLALIVLGPQKLPELARSLGRGMREFRKMQDEVKDMVKIDLNPEPPAVHQPGVSGSKRTPARPHRTARPGAPAADDDAASSETAPDEPSPSGEREPDVPGGSGGDDTATTRTDAPQARDDDPDGPPAAAGAG